MERNSKIFLKAQKVFHSQSHWERRLSLHHDINKNIPRYLYKYKSINPDNKQSINKIRDILVRSGLWLSSPTKFNDPFDMSAYIYAEGSGLDKRNKAKRLAKSKGFRRKKRNKFVKMFMKFTDKETTKFASKALSNQLKDMGVCSFAGDPRSILMWSHYSGDHTGICFQFEVAHEFLMVGYTLEVEYSPEYPKLNWVTAEPKQLLDVLLRKYEGWTYENEHRMILLDKANHNLRFNSNALTGIIFGCRATDKIIGKVQELLKERKESGKPDVKLYKAVQHKSKYALSIHRY